MTTKETNGIPKNLGKSLLDMMDSGLVVTGDDAPDCAFHKRLELTCHVG